VQPQETDHLKTRAHSALLFLLLVVSSSCSHYILIQPSDYSGMERCRERGYRIRTMDQQQYVVTCLALEDSALIVKELKVGSKGSVRPVPFALPYGQIDKVEKIDQNVIVPVVAGAAVVFLIVQWNKLSIGPDN
jgi:hypothetical protein